MARMEYLPSMLTEPSSRIGSSRGPSQLYDEGDSFYYGWPLLDVLPCFSF